VLDPVIMTIMIIMFYISYFKTKSYGKLLIIKNSLPWRLQQKQNMGVMVIIWGSSFCCLDHAERQEGAPVLVLGRTKLCFQSKEGPSAFIEKKKKSREIRVRVVTAIPSGKQRQKKSGRGRPTASLIASVRTPVMSTENRMPGCEI
jgi:hypothetical protein